MRCDELADLLPAVAEDPASLDRWAAAHLSTCLRCQREVAHYRRMARRLRQLRWCRPVAPDDLVGEVLTRLDAMAERLDAAAERGGRAGRHGRRLAYGGAALGVVAVGATVAMAVARGRSVVPLGNVPVPGGNV